MVNKVGRSIHFIVIVVHIPGDQHRPGFIQVQKQGLVAGSMTRREFNNDATVPKYIVVAVFYQYCFAVFEFAKKFLIGCHRAKPFKIGAGVEHGFMLRPLHQPGGATEQIGVGDMIIVIVGEGQEIDVVWRIAHFLELVCQLPRAGKGTLAGGCSVHSDFRIRDFSRVPEQGPTGMHHQIAGSGHFSGNFAGLKAKFFGGYTVDFAAIEYIELKQGIGIRLSAGPGLIELRCLRLCGRDNCQNYVLP